MNTIVRVSILSVGVALTGLQMTGCWGRDATEPAPAGSSTQQPSVGHQPSQGIQTSTPRGTEDISTRSAGARTGGTTTNPSSGGQTAESTPNVISGYPAISACSHPLSRLIPGRDGAVVLTSTDFSTGAVGWINPRTKQVFPDLGLASTDTRIKHSDKHNFLINRYQYDTIVIFERNATLTQVGEFSVRGPESTSANPHDVVVDAKGQLHVSFLGRNHLEVYDISDPATPRLAREIDLSAFSDADGLPEASQIIQCGETYFVLIQRLDRNAGWVPVDHSYLVPIYGPSGFLYDFDGSGDQKPDGIRLEGTGMSSWRKDPRIADGTRILALNRGLQSVDLKTAKVDVVIPEKVFADRGMDIWDVRNFVLSPDGRWVWILAIDGWPKHTIFRASLDNMGRDLTPAIQGIESVDASMIRIEDSIWLADSTDGASGVRIFDIQGDQLVESPDSPLPVGLPPYWLHFAP